jgi:hypothetical protein
MATAHPALQAAVRLRRALDQNASALATAQLDALLAGQTALQDAITSIPRISDISADDRRVLRAELDAARDALARCRHLGANLTAFVRVTLDAHGRAAGYDPQRITAAALAGRDLNTRA